MSCPICQKTVPVPVCTSTLTLGTISSNNAAVWIYIENLTTGRKKRESGTSSGAGLVTLAMSNDPTFYMEGHVYEVSITLQSAVSLYDTKDITIAGIPYNCLQVVFEEVSNDVDGWYPYSNITVEIA